MTNYELMLILDSTISDSDREESIKGLKAVLEEAKAKISNEDVWGEKKLAYKINKSNRGYYYLYDLELDGTAIKSISRELNLDKNIVRYIFVKKDA